jgi:hypothetical protein
MRFLGGKLLFGEAISARIILPNNVQVKHQLKYQLAHKEIRPIASPNTVSAQVLINAEIV